MRDFDFFEERYKTREHKRLMLSWLIAVGGVLMFATISVFIISYTSNRRIEDLRSLIEANNQYLSSLGTLEKISQREALSAQLRDLTMYNSRLAMLSDIVKSSSVVKAELLVSISEKTPVDTSINTMSVTSDGVLNISGVCAKETSVAEFQHSLKELDSVKRVHIGSITKQNETEYGFTMSVDVDIKDVTLEDVED